MVDRSKYLVRIVDDDEALRDAMLFLLESQGYVAKAYESAEDFLERDNARVPGCLLLDVKMAGMSGLELQEHMRRCESRTPIVFLSAHGSINMAVDVLQRGAVSFLPKPVERERLIDALDRALAAVPAPLSAREGQVVGYVANGLTNREIAEVLGISKRIVEFFRASAMRKLGARNAAELVEKSRTGSAS